MYRLLFILTLLYPSTASAGWFSYDNYDDCMLGKMKGQNQSVLSSAMKECERMFKVEQSIMADSVKWSFDSKIGTTKIMIEDNPEYIFTKARFYFSDKPCKDSTTADFTETDFIEIRGGVGTLVHPTYGTYQCGRPRSFRGIYK